MTNTKIQALANKIKELITTHANVTANSSQKGHSQAGGVPQAIGDSLSAGTDNGYYSRADHVHTVDYSKIQNVPTTFAPQSHTHTKTNITDYLKSDNISANDSLNDYKTEGIYCCGYYNANQPELPTSVVSVGYTLIVLNNNRQLKEVQGNIPRTYESTKQILISEDNEIFIRKYYEIRFSGTVIDNSEWTSWVKKDITYTAASATPIADTSSGAVGASSKYAREDHTHPQSALYAEANHNHTLSNISDLIECYKGVNMLKGTRLFTTPDADPTSSIITETYHDCNVRYIQNLSSQNNMSYEYYIPYSNITNGAYYTLSFWAKASTNHSFLYTYWYIKDSDCTKRISSNSTYTGHNGEGGSFGDGGTRFDVTTDWKRYYVVFQANPNPSDTSNNRRLTIRLNKNSSSYDLYLAGVKFEKGNKATPYCENMMDYVGDAITYINQ